MKLTIKIYPLDSEEIKKIGAIKKDRVRRETALEAAQKLYAEKESEMGEDLIRRIEREVYLQMLDT